jgi:hypothetical protein
MARTRSDFGRLALPVATAMPSSRQNPVGRLMTETRARSDSSTNASMESIIRSGSRITVAPMASVRKISSTELSKLSLWNWSTRSPSTQP